MQVNEAVSHKNGGSSMELQPLFVEGDHILI